MIYLNDLIKNFSKNELLKREYIWGYYSERKKSECIQQEELKNR